MNPRERLLTIRLMEKLREHPEYANQLGLTVSAQEKPPADKNRERPVK